MSDWSGEFTERRSMVYETHYSVHTKKDVPDDHPKTMRVKYCISTTFSISEWVCFEHSGFAFNKAQAWWAKRSRLPCPHSSTEAVRMALAGALAESLAIVTKKNLGDRWPDLLSVDLGPIPTPIPKKRCSPIPKKRCYYEVLKIKNGAADEEIKLSFRKLAMQWHPDRNAGNPDAEVRFREVAEAYEALRNWEGRKRYEQQSYN